MRKDNKVIIVLLVLLFIFFIVMFALFGINNIKQDSYSSTIIIGDSTVWKYNNKKWLNIRLSSSLEELSWKTYSIYSANEKLGDYQLWYSDNKWYAFDKDKNAVNLPDKFIAYDSNFKINMLNFEKKQVEDYTYVYKVLEENSIPVDSTYSSIYKTSIDFDKDGIEEDFYIATNALSFDSADKTFGFAFMVKNNEIYQIYYDVDSNNYYDGCKPYYNTFLDVNNDGVYEFILTCGKYSKQEQIDMLYQWIDGKFKIAISNQ